MCGNNKAKMKVGTISKLPSFEPEMKDAIRKHIIMKRQRLKQELEQEAIMKRLKKEREQKRIQDAMTLDQIKDQLSNLEKKLETLRNDKHNLFVQLKQALNESNSKRKSSEAKISGSSGDAKKPRLGEDGKDVDLPGEGKEIRHKSSNKFTSLSDDKSSSTDSTSNLASNHFSIAREVIAQPSLPPPLVPGNSKPTPSQIKCKSTPLKTSEHQNSNLYMRLPAMDLDQNRAFAMAHQNRQNLINLTEHGPLLPPSVTSQSFPPPHDISRGQSSGVDRYFPTHLPPNHLIGAWNTVRTGYPFGPIESRLSSLPFYNSHDTARGIGRQQVQLKLISEHDISGGSIHQANNAASLDTFDSELLNLKKRHNLVAPVYPNQFALGQSFPGSFTHLNPFDQATLMGSMSDSSFVSRSTNLVDTSMSYHQSPRKPLTNRNHSRSKADYRLDVQQSGPGSQYAVGHQFYAVMPPASAHGQEGKMDLKHLPVQQIPSRPATHLSTSMAQHQQLHHQEQIPRTFHRANLGNAHNRSSLQKASRHK